MRPIREAFDKMPGMDSDGGVLIPARSRGKESETTVR